MGCKVTNASDMTINSNLELLYEKNTTTDLYILRSELIPLITGYSIIVDVAFYTSNNTNRIDYARSYDVNELIKVIEIARKSYEYFGEQYTAMEVRPFIGKSGTTLYCLYNPKTDNIQFFHGGNNITKRALYGIK